MMRAAGKFLRIAARRYCVDRSGAAAAEFALVVTVLTIPVLNVVDFALYAWDKMQLDNAAQMAARAAWVTCDSGSKLPALSNCTNLATAAAAAAHSSSLGSNVTVGTMTEGYYCANSGGTGLQSAGTASDCSGINGSTDQPGDYIFIPVTYTYTPIFPAVSIVSVLPANMQSVGQMRLS